MSTNTELIPIGSIDVSPGGTTKAILTNGGFLVVQHGDQFVTTEAAEAYAEARVREALEVAASIARENYLAAYAGRVDVDEADDDDRNTEIFNVGQIAQALAYSKMEEAIRALTPTTK